MRHEISAQDRLFQQQFESGELLPADFGHRAHVQIAYIYLVGRTTHEAYEAMRNALLSFLEHHGVGLSKYHDTLTRAWIMAVRHFMEKGPACKSADEFMRQNPELLDSGIMMTHYSAECLFSDRARAEFVQPDVDDIPRYSGTTN